MQELLVLAVVLTAIAVLVSFGYGIYALRLMRSHADHTGLRLAALNLLEPSATIGTMLALGLATDAFNSRESAPPFLLLAAVPLTLMLLAPIKTRAESALHRAVAVYGGLRWINTIAFWGVGITALENTSSQEAFVLAAVLIGSGLLILVTSVIHIGSSLEAVKTQRVQ